MPPFERPVITTDRRMELGRSALEIHSNGVYVLYQDGALIRRFHSIAKDAQGRCVDTRTARRVGIEETAEQTLWGPARTLRVTYEEEGLVLEQRLSLLEQGGELIASIALHDPEKPVETNYLAPVDAVYPAKDEKPLFLRLDQRMLLAPYDNDMWTRWEAAPLRAGRTSYDISAIFDDKTRCGLIIGALDHDVWKNGIICSAWDARCVTAVSGVADASTHDGLPHGTITGDWVESSRFAVSWTEDIRDGLERFACLCLAKRPAMAWNKPAPFGWNSFSGVGHTTLESWSVTSDFFQELPEFHDAEGVQYINLDAAFGLDAEKRKALVRKMHARGQKCGTYGSPFLFFDFVADREAPGTGGVKFSEMVLRDEKGKLLHPVDGMRALDCTHPAWEKYARNMIRSAADEGFDYLKIDFLSHGALEGCHFDPAVRTGRQAYTRGMRIIQDEIEHLERPMFLSLSIAPIFPYGYGHARRCCCDSFGHWDDVRYVLNALNFGWWTNQSLYAFNDPDHVTLYNSVIDGRGPTLLSEARSRFNSAVISGTVLLLSDNYGPDGDADIHKRSRERTKLLANNARLNAIARGKVAFRPVELTSDTTAVYTGKVDGKTYVAFFNFTKEPAYVTLEAQRGGIPASGRVTDLNRDISWDYRSVLTVALEPMDSAILEIAD